MEMGPAQRIGESQCVPISVILRARTSFGAMVNWCIEGINLESAGEQLHSRKPDVCEIHPTTHRTSSVYPITDLRKDWRCDYVTPYQSRCFHSHIWGSNTRQICLGLELVNFSLKK